MTRFESQIMGKFISEKEHISDIETKLLNDQRVSRKEYMELYGYLTNQLALLRKELKVSSQHTVGSDEK